MKRAQVLVCMCIAIFWPCKTAFLAGEAEFLALDQRGAGIFKVRQPGKEFRTG